MLPRILSARSVLQTMVNGSDSWCMPGGHDEWSEGTRGALSAERHDHLSLAASDTARVDNAAAVDGSGVGVSGDVSSDEGVGALVCRCLHTAARAEQQHHVQAVAVSMIACAQLCILIWQ